MRGNSIKKIVIANWKMQLTLKESVALAKEVVRGVTETSGAIVLCPSFTALASVGALVHGKIALGAQDVFWEAKGAYTGAIGPRLLVEMGCRYVLVGHSERRRYCGETDSMVNKKVLAALAAGLIPVICVGETAEERREVRKDFVVMRQVAEAIRGVVLSGAQQLIIAYEPVWVIGSGQAVDPDDAEYMIQVIRHTLTDTIPPETLSRACRFLYGGSVDAKNVAAFTSRATIDGVLVGGASLNASAFFAMVQEVV